MNNRFLMNDRRNNDRNNYKYSYDNEIDIMENRNFKDKFQNNFQDDYNDNYQDNAYNLNENMVNDDIDMLYEENAQLKDKIQYLNKLLFEKDKEMQSKLLNSDSDLLQINKAFDSNVNNYQKLVENCNKIQEELNQKNIIIKNLESKLNNENLNNNDSNNNVNNNANNSIFDGFYGEFINLISDFIFKGDGGEYSSMIGSFPKFSLEEKANKKYKDVLESISVLIDIINFLSDEIKNKNNENNVNEDTTYNEEANKRLKEMSVLLANNNEYLEKTREDNINLKQKLSKLENDYNSLLKSKNIDPKTIMKTFESDQEEKLKNELNKKNQEIKSLEHIITRLTTGDNNKENSINQSSGRKNNNEYKGKIVGKETFNILKKGGDENLKDLLKGSDNIFVKDDENEKNLGMFLDKFTQGGYTLFGKNDENGF